MKSLLVLGVCGVLVVEASALTARHRGVVLLAAAAVAAVTMVAARWVLTREDRAGHDESKARDPAATLRRWLARTETLVARADTTRADWDKHLRPMLARQFELATGQRRSRDANAFHATALMLFGAELWQWVDPDAVSLTGAAEPGPGRGVLDELLQRLERI